MTVGTGTLEWMAPELISGDGKYDSSVDVFAFGMVLYSMLSLKQPHEALEQALIDKSEGGASIAAGAGIAPAALIHAVCTEQLRPSLDTLRPKIPTTLPDIVKMAWHQDPKARPSFTKILSMLNSFEALHDFDAGPLSMEVEAVTEEEGEEEEEEEEEEEGNAAIIVSLAQLHPINSDHEFQFINPITSEANAAQPQARQQAAL